MIDRGDNFELTFGKLRNLDDTSSSGPFSAYHEFGGLWDPLDIIRSIVSRFVEMLDDLWCVCGLHSLYQNLF